MYTSSFSPLFSQKLHRFMFLPPPFDLAVQLLPLVLCEDLLDPGELIGDKTGDSLYLFKN